MKFVIGHKRIIRCAFFVSLAAIFILTACRGNFIEWLLLQVSKKYSNVHNPVLLLWDLSQIIRTSDIDYFQAALPKSEKRYEIIFFTSTGCCTKSVSKHIGYLLDNLEIPNSWFFSSHSGTCKSNSLSILSSINNQAIVIPPHKEHIIILSGIKAYQDTVSSGLFDPLFSYIQYLKYDVVAVITTLQFDMNGIPILTEDSFPVALTPQLLEILIKRRINSLDTLVMDILSNGLSLHVIDPTLSSIDWRKVYHFCLEDNRSKSQKHPDCAHFSGLVAPFPGIDEQVTRSLASGRSPGSWSSSRNSSSSLSQQQQQRAQTNRDQTLVVYVYTETWPNGKSNLLFFLEHAHHPSSGDSNSHFILMANEIVAIELSSSANFDVVRCNRSCSGIYDWGPVVLQHALNYRHFLVIDSSVRGPYLPGAWNFGRQYWFEAFTGRLTSDVKLVGLSVNCPDNAGGGFPHIKSSLLAFDSTAVEIWSREKFLSCAPTNNQRCAGDDALTFAVLKAGYNMASMQRQYEGVDWRQCLATHSSIVPVSSCSRNTVNCRGIIQDIFSISKGHSNAPHPYEFLFVETVGGVYGDHLDSLDYLAATAPFAQGTAKNQCLLLSYSSSLDGPSIWLSRVASIMMSLGYEIAFVSSESGPIADRFRSLGARVFVNQIPIWKEPPIVFATWFRSLRLNLRFQNFRPSVAFFNTILFAPLVSSISPFLTDSCKFVWVVHEAGIRSRSTAFDSLSNSSYTHNMKSLEFGNHIWSSVFTLWLSDSARAVVSKFDRGQFITMRGFVEKCSNSSRDILKLKEDVRQRLGFSQKHVVISIIGKICQSKQQKWIVQFILQLLRSGNKRARRVRFLVLGGGFGGAYEEEFKRDIERHHLSSYIHVYPSSESSKILSIAADIHISLSTDDAFPLNTIEMMCYEVPVLATPAFGTREQILDSPHSGILLDSVSDYEGFSTNLLKLMNTSKAKLAKVGSSGRKIVDRYFSQETAKMNLIGLLQNLNRNVVPKNKVCVVMRFCGQHLSEDRFSLENSIVSLLGQQHRDWELLLVPTDTSDITKVYPLLVKYNERMNIRLIHYDDLQPYEGGNVAKYIEFHRYVYSLTDRAISQCSDDSSWLLATNGDNTYDPRFFNYLDSRYDIIAYDFYSRYLNGMSGRPGCEKLFHADRNPSYVSCMPNTLQIKNTDLGANVYNLIRWRREGLRYSDFIVPLPDQDGHMAEAVVRNNWTARFVRMQETGACLYYHNPNYQSCVKVSNDTIWDDRTQNCVNKKDMATHQSLSKLLPRCLA